MARSRREADDSADLMLSRRARARAEGADAHAPLFSWFAVGLAFALSPMIGGWVVLAINGCLRGWWLRAALLLAPILVIPAALAVLAGIGPLIDRTIADSELSCRLGVFALAVVMIHLGVATYFVLWQLRILFYKMLAWQASFFAGVPVPSNDALGLARPTAPVWPALVIALFGAVLSVGPAFGALYVSAELLDERLGHEILFANAQKLHFGGSVTQAEANRLGTVLHQAGYFRGNRGLSAHVTREQGSVVVSFPFDEADRRRPEMLAWLRQVRATMAARAFPGEAVTVRLCDMRWREQSILD